jgi:hypothetical protein
LLDLLRVNNIFQYEKQLIKTSKNKEVNCNEPPSVRASCYIHAEHTSLQHHDKLYNSKIVLLNGPLLTHSSTYKYKMSTYVSNEICLLGNLAN